VLGHIFWKLRQFEKPVFIGPEEIRGSAFESDGPGFFEELLTKIL
jgi:hypothetical protein